MLDVKSMTLAELKAVEKVVAGEIKTRSHLRQLELVQAVCDAMNALAAEFPLTDLEVVLECGDYCREFDVNILDYFCEGRKMTPKDFCMYD